MATRQVGEETPTPRAYDLVQPYQVITLIEGTFLSWLQRDDWRVSHAPYKALCHQSLRTLLGAG